jgi:hypothetical protein
MTEITKEQWTMLQYWTALTPKITAKELVGCFLKRFSVPEGTAWIIVTRYRNQKHSEQYGG